MKELKKLWRWLSWGITGLAVTGAALLLVLRAAGYAPYAVLSGSMEPTYPVGSLIYVHDTAPGTIGVGDVISFVLAEDGTVATHRVVERGADGRAFYTKGDANESRDGQPVAAENILGVVKFHVPLLGYAAVWLREGGGRWAVLAVGTGVLLLMALSRALRGKTCAARAQREFYPAEEPDKKYSIPKGEAK